MSSWAFQETSQGREIAFKMGEELGCTAADSTSLRDCLRDVSDVELYEAGEAVSGHNQKRFKNCKHNISAHTSTLFIFEKLFIRIMSKLSQILLVHKLIWYVICILQSSIKWKKVYFRSQILERPRIGEYWNISGVPVLPENVIFTFFGTCWCYSEAYNTGMQKWSSIVQDSCTSISDFKYTFSKKSYEIECRPIISSP